MTTSAALIAEVQESKDIMILYQKLIGIYWDSKFLIYQNGLVILFIGKKLKMDGQKWI